MKSRKKFFRRIITVFVVFSLIGCFLTLDLTKNAELVEAKQNIFSEITPYQVSGLKILEITPTSDDTELGYFFQATTDNEKNRYVTNTTFGKKFNTVLPNFDVISAAYAQAEQNAVNFATQQADDEWQRNHRNESKDGEWYRGYYQQKYDEYMRTSYQNDVNTILSNAGIGNAYYAETDPYLAAELRRFGMIKPVGTDALIGTLSEYPIYDTNHKGIFGTVAGTNDFVDVEIPSSRFLEGYYEINEANNGAYKLKEGYYIATGQEVLENAVDGNGNPIHHLEARHIYKVAGNLESDNGSVSGNLYNSESISDLKSDMIEEASTGRSGISANSVESSNVIKSNATGDEDTDVTQYVEIPVIPNTSGIPEGVELAGANGNLNFIHLPNAAGLYYGHDSETLVYLGGSNRYYAVGNWIKEYILGDSELGCNLSYTNKTISDVTISDIQNADLIYISGTAEEYGSLVMSEDVVKEIYNQSAIYHKAVIMDYAVYSGNMVALSNLDKLALLLWQEDQKAVSQMESCAGFFVDKPADPGAGNAGADDGSLESDKVIDNINGLLNDASVFTALSGTMMSGYNHNFAVNNIYVYEHHYQDFQNSKLAQFQNNAMDNIANGDLNSVYTAAMMSGGFQSVLAYIKLNNNRVTVGKMAEGIVTPAIAIQYILSYRGEELAVAKNSYRVLEIQPTKEFKFNSGLDSKDYTLETDAVKGNRNTFIEKCLNPEITASGSQDFVSFDSVTIDTFNTMRTDLITEYDVVYIGALHNSYYEHKTGRSATYDEKGEIVYDEEASLPSFSGYSMMCGNVYYNSYGFNLYSSRDLTEAKLIELKEYLQKDGLVIVDESLLKTISQGNTKINPTAVSERSMEEEDHGRMDNSSNMYELFQFARGFNVENSVSGQYVPSGNSYSNLVSEGDLVSGMARRADLTSYLNRERISLRFDKMPTEYTYSSNGGGFMSSVVYQATDRTDGKYYLEYEFAINNNAKLVDNGARYAIHYYQDLNADGSFDDSEEKFDYSITRTADGGAADGTTDADGVTRYSLNSDVSYRLRRQVPSDEGGIIDWCIKVVRISESEDVAAGASVITASDRIYCSESGYTAIKPREKKYINILQIQPNGNAGTINLETLNDQDSLYKYIHAMSVTDQYEINVRTITVDQFERDITNYYTSNKKDGVGSEEVYQSYFNSFQRTDKNIYSETDIENDKDKPMSVNMIILGFGESYDQFTSSHSVMALKTYIESNRPVLASNNVTGVPGAISILHNENRSLNYELMNYFGMDRYGYTNPLYYSLFGTEEVKDDSGNVIGNRYTNDEMTYTRTEAACQQYINPRETGNNAVSYTASSARGQVHIIPIGYTNTARARMADAGYGFIKTNAVKLLATADVAQKDSVTANASRTYVDGMNEGQISHYPYNLGNKVLLSKSHAQNYQLDLDSDSNTDGNSDIVVWYTLGDMAGDDGASIESANIYSATPGDGINNYYVYNNGNVTFTGFGQRPASQITSGEAQLFVNTLIAAYEAGLVNPTVSYYETADSNASMLESIAVPYDVNVTGNNTIDSSIQMNETGTDYLYKFVNPNTNPETAPSGTKAYFKVQDSNLVKGDKTCKVEFYLGVEDTSNHRYLWPDGTISDILNIQLSDNTVVSVVRIPIDIYRADFSAKVGTSNGNAALNPRLEVGMMYGFYAPMSYLNDRGVAEIYIQADTSYRVLSSSTGQYVDRPLGTAYDMFTMIKQDLLKLD